MIRPTSSRRVGELLAWARRELAALEACNPSVESTELLEWAAGVANRWQLGDTVDEESTRRFVEAVAQRTQNRPLQLITGRMYFRCLTLHARPGVFICRPETEIVAGLAIEASKPGDIVVDLCTGSGAIALAIATECPATLVHAVELSPLACELAAQNIDAIAAGAVMLHNADATSDATLTQLDGSVDIVVSNPPYVPAAEAPTQPEALLDPDLALYGGGADGMEIPEKIIRRAAGLLKESGTLIVEHSASQSALMRQCASSYGFSDVTTVVDLTGKDRVLVARRGTIDE
ncbi:peptide chain release factor N(5)-glutamine methyltransferase [Schaalia vaccimaxillae]|uniref:peptide chain release factor N(5)-glutamine methyltransferase n=1 Tax=Schaalia vaccimaxillae TaxID=183916 RepID=UPI0003B340C1|nr:peptide chain release factor N(5)-glutamine methyltransferase [Schaalia vaccimaxillae]